MFIKEEWYVPEKVIVVWQEYFSKLLELDMRRTEDKKEFENAFFEDEGLEQDDYLD